jgi:hypothetical protein
MKKAQSMFRLRLEVQFYTNINISDFYNYLFRLQVIIMAQQDFTAKLIRSKCQPETGVSTGNLTQ